MGAALGFGFLLEILLLVLMVVAVNLFPNKVGEPVGDLLQAPASYLVPLLAKLQQPGFEEQVGYLLLIPLIQWPVYTVLIYLWLSRSGKKGSSAVAPAEGLIDLPQPNKRVNELD